MYINEWLIIEVHSNKTLVYNFTLTSNDTS